MRRFFCALLFAVLAAPVLNAKEKPSPLEDFYLDIVQQVGNQAWLVYQRKLIQLLETYSYRTDRDGHFIEYSTRNSDVCAMGSDPGIVYRTTVANIDKEKNNQVNIEHWGCGELRLKEYIYVEGDGDYRLSNLMAFTGVRPFSVPKGQDRLIYEIRTQFDETIFRLVESRTNYGRQFQFYLKDELLLLFDYNAKKETLFVNTYGFEAEWVFGPGSRWAWKMNRDESGIFAYLSSQGQVLFIGSNSGLDRSLSEFRGFFSGLALGNVRMVVSDLLALIDQQLLPKSEFSTAGGANDELIRKLEELVDQLQRNDVQTVIFELLQILEEVKAGKIRVLE